MQFACYKLLCCRIKCVNDLTWFKRNAKGLRGQIALNIFFQNEQIEGAQWPSGRVLNSRPRGCGFEPNYRHFTVSFSNT